MSKEYIAKLVERTPRPRSKRLRNQGIGGATVNTVLNITESAGNNAGGDGHTHKNLSDLDKFTTDENGYGYLTRLVEALDEETGETSVSEVTEKIKAGYADHAAEADQATHADEADKADEAEALTEDSPTRDDFLSATADDEAAGLITFDKGFQTKGFVTGQTGTGGKMDSSGAAEMQSLTLRSWLEAPEYRFNRISVSLGNTWRAPGGGIIESVTADEDADGNELTTGTVTLKLEDGDSGAVAVGDYCQGIYHDITTSNNATADLDDGIGNFEFMGFCTSYFKVTALITDSGTVTGFTYELRPTSDTWTKQVHPFVGMHFVAYCNPDDTSRQTAVYETRTYIRFLRNLTDWEFTADNIAAQFGDLSNLSVFDLSMTGYSAYLDNIYINGVFKSTDGSLTIDSVNNAMNLGDALVWKDNTLTIEGDVIVQGDGSTVAIPSYKGAYDSSTTYYKANVVTDNGSSYIYIYDLPTSGHPTTDTNYWSLYASKGDTGSDAEVYSIVFRLVTASGSYAVDTVNWTTLSAMTDASLQAEFYLNNEAYDAPAAKLWTTDKEGNVLGVAIEPTNVSGSVVTADDLYMDEDTGAVVCRMLDASGNVLCERSIPVVADGATGASGADAVYTSVESSEGLTVVHHRSTDTYGFPSGATTSTLTAHCWKGGTEVTEGVTYSWVRTVAGVEDTSFSATAQTVTVTASDLAGGVRYTCTTTIN